MNAENNDSVHFDGMQRGKLYELVIFIHMLINNKDKEFDLGKQIVFGDKWDDLVVRVNNRYSFLQIKLVDNIEKNAIDSKVLLGEKQISLKKVDFKLQKYFISYLRIQDQLNSRRDGSKIEKLILFTNVALNEKELNRKVCRTKRIRKSNRDDIIPNTANDSSSYKMLLVKNDAFFKKVVDVQSDLEILAKELAKYAIVTNSKSETMVLDKDSFHYYHRALIDENVIELLENLQTKFTKQFIYNENLSCRAQNLRKKLININRKQIDEQELKANMEKARWTVSDDFCSSKTKDKIFLPNYEINDKAKKDFFDILELRVNQLGVKDIRKKIENSEIQKAFLKYYDLDPKLITFLINDYLLDQKLQNTTKERWFLHNERSIFIEKLQSKIFKPIATLKTQKHLSSLMEIDQKYDLSSYDDYIFSEKCLNTKKVLIVKTSSVTLTSLKIVKTLNRKNREDYIFINLECLPEENEMIDFVYALKHDGFNLCIISYQQLVKDKLSMKIFQLLKDIKKQVIFITPIADDFLVNQFDECKKLEDVRLGLQYLIDCSKIFKREIIMQGQSLKLSDLMTSREDYKCINAEIINRLINKEIIEIRTKLPSMGDLEGAYSEFDSVEEINIETFIYKLSTKNWSDIYIISGVPGSDQKSNLVRYLFTNVNNKKFQISNLNIIKMNIKSRIETFNQNTGEAVNHNILVADGKFDEMHFKQICRNNLKKRVYWINLEFEGKDPKFILEQIYNPNFYIEGERICSEVFIDKKIKDELNSPRLSDVYIIVSRNKENIIEWLNISENKEFIKQNFKNNKILLFTSQDNAETSFQSLSFTNSTIHLLKFEHDQFIWKKTHGSSRNLIKYKYRNKIVQDTRYKMHEDEYLSEIKNKQDIIIAAEPGMGKSTTLIQLCLKYILRCDDKKSYWVIPVNLKNHYQEIKIIDMDNLNKEISISIIIEFLSLVDESLKDNFAKVVLKLALLNKQFPKPLIIAFDGFDEVLDETHRIKILSLLKFLKYQTETKFFITTRLHYEPILEDALSTFAVRIFPIDHLTKRKFIINYLETRLNLILSHDEITEFFHTENPGMDKHIELFLGKLQYVFNNDVSSFIGTPLQLYLTLESCATDFKKCMKDGIQNLLFSYLDGDISDIYKRFINKKYNIYYKKFNVNIGRMKILLETYFNECHRKVAKSYILKANLKESIKDSEDLIQSVGIIKYQNCSVEFIHPTFAEYYVADTFMHWIKKWGEKNSHQLINSQKEKYFITNILLVQDYKVVRVFLNNELLKLNVQDIRLNKDYYNPELLSVAINEGALGIARFILRTFSIDVNTEKLHERPILFEAVGTEILEIIKLFLDEGADIHAKDFAGMTILHYAARDFPDLVESLLMYGADIHAKDNDGRTALHAAASGAASLDTMEVLVDSGIDLNAKDNNGQTALHYFVDFEVDLEVPVFLIKSGADVHEKDNEGQTALHCASEDCNWELILRLFLLGADVKAKNNKGETCLHVLYRAGNKGVIEHLVELRANINAKDNKGETILHVAVRSGDLEAVEFFVELGADVDAKNNNGETVKDLAIKCGKTDIIEYMESAEEDERVDDGIVVRYWP